MHFLRRSLVVLMLLGLTAAGCAKKGTPSSTGTPEASPTAAASPTAGAKASGTEFELDLTGAEEKPGPGDTDGKGKAQLTLDEAGKKVCFELEASGIGAPDKAHIHEGAKGIAGPIVVTLTPPAGSAAPFKSEGCVDTDAALIARIKSQPQNFYVNVHNPEFPNGAIRGQLPASPTGAGAASPTGGGSSTPTSTTGY